MNCDEVNMVGYFRACNIPVARQAFTAATQPANLPQCYLHHSMLVPQHHSPDRPASFSRLGRQGLGKSLYSPWPLPESPAFPEVLKMLLPTQAVAQSVRGLFHVGWKVGNSDKEANWSVDLEAPS